MTAKVETRFYETVFIARQDLSEKQVQDLTKDYEKLIKDNGGKVVNTESWGLRSFAYRIRKNRKGHYTMFHIDGPAAAVLEMERQMRLNEDVLRYLTIRIDEIPTEPSVMVRGSDDDYAAAA